MNKKKIARNSSEMCMEIPGTLLLDKTKNLVLSSINTVSNNTAQAHWAISTEVIQYEKSKTDKSDKKRTPKFNTDTHL